MTAFSTMQLPDVRDVAAPDGSDVRILSSLAAGSMAHFTLAPAAIATAVCHRTVEEIWYVLAGEGDIWRKQDAQEEVTRLAPGTCLTIPAGTRFQFRATGSEDLKILGVTMPPWPGEDEAYVVEGHWTPTVP